MMTSDRGCYVYIVPPGARFLLNEEDAVAILNHIVETVRNSWQLILQESGVTETDRKMIESAFLYKGFFY